VPHPQVRHKSDKDASQMGIRPRMFKTAIGKGHAEFSTSQQQDAFEFLQHLLTKLQREVGHGC
jgi:ubiquitin carboxyl-terminal hydrolase 5/13